MKGLIQRFPAALLPLLSIKASETPPALDDVVSPSLEMLPAYAADRFEIQSAFAAGIVAQNVNAAPITVPAGEYWLVQQLCCIASNITVASNVQLAAVIIDPAGVTTYVAAQDAQHASIAGQIFAVSWDGPVLLRPGMKLSGGTLVAPTSVDITVRALVARFSPQ